MTILAPIKPVAAGTPHAESFHSLLQRTAAAHNVSFSRLLKFLHAMRGDGSTAGLKGLEVLAGLAGTGSVTRELVSTHEKLSGTADLAGHTLLPLSGVISPRANGAFAKTQRWCPICIHPDKGTGYGMFAHLFAAVTNCQTHDVRLEEFCAVCYRPQTSLAVLIARPECTTCRAPLWKKVTGPRVRTHYDAWAEHQLYSLVAALSDAALPAPSTDWISETGDTLRRLSEEARGRMKGVDAAQARLLRRPPTYGFKLPTLLWLAATHSTTLLEVVLRPNEVLSGVFPQLEPVRRCLSPKQMHSIIKRPLYRELLLALLKREHEVQLPSAATLAALLGTGVPSSGERDLLRRYSAARASQFRGSIAWACDREFAKLVLPHLPDKRVKHLALERILARKPRVLSPGLKQNVANAVDITRGVLGRVVTVSPDTLKGLHYEALSHRRSS